jgi:hypothetical protein
MFDLLISTIDGLLFKLNWETYEVHADTTLLEKKDSKGVISGTPGLFENPRGSMYWYTHHHHHSPWVICRLQLEWKQPESQDTLGGTLGRDSLNVAAFGQDCTGVTFFLMFPIS